jgi:glycosyltransferase involved in cell wall biosynthesis
VAAPVADQVANDDDEQRALQIATTYLLVSDIPLVQDSAGRFWADRLWWTDLVEHCCYLKSFRLAAPIIEGQPEQDMVPLDRGPTEHLVVVPMVYADSMLSALWVLYENAKRLNIAVRDAGVVHACYVGWPLPLSWIAQPLAMLQHKPVVAIIESMFWKAIAPNASFKNRVRSSVTDWLNWALVRGASVRIFSTNAYRNYFVDEDSGTVIPCSWVDPKDIKSNSDVLSDFSVKSLRMNLRVLFAGRMNEQKGLAVLLEAAALLDTDVPRVYVDIVGDGPLKSATIDASGRLRNLRYIKPVPYGPAFYGLLRKYDLIVVPSLTDEQPRIVFDAYSQGVPVLASRTTGLADCVREGETGMLVDVGNPRALAEALAWCAENKSALAALALGGLASVKRDNIKTMHSRRAKLLKEYGIT